MSSTRQRCQVTFTEVRAPSPYHLPQPTLWTEATPCKMADWSRSRGEDQAILIEEDVYPTTEPHLQQLLGEKEPSPVGAKVGDGLPTQQMSISPPPLPCEDQEPSPLCTSEWMDWCARYVQMPPWWEELLKIPSHADYEEFAWKVCASFEVPMACNWVKKIDNYHVEPPANPSIRKHHFLPPENVRFGAQDICLTQLHHTINLCKESAALGQRGVPPSPQPHHLVRSVQELWWAMEPLVTFTEGDVFMTMVPSK